MRKRNVWGWLGFVAWLVILAAFLALSSVASNEPAYAQAPGGAPAAPPAAAPAAGAPAATTPAATKQADKTLIRKYFEALGYRYTIAFLFLSFVLVAVTVMCVLAARRDSIVPLQLVEAFEAQLNEKKYQEAYEMAKADDSFLGKVLSAGLAKLSAGFDKAQAAMQEVGDDENMRIEHRLSYISLIGTLAPMIGLLGTVDGMVTAFDTIASKDTQPKPSELAVGVATALVTTLVGLWIAIPAIAIYNILKNRMSRLVMEVGVVSEGLMNRFEGVGIKK